MAGAAQVGLGYPHVLCAAQEQHVLFFFFLTAGLKRDTGRTDRQLEANSVPY